MYVLLGIFIHQYIYFWGKQVNVLSRTGQKENFINWTLFHNMYHHKIQYLKFSLYTAFSRHEASFVEWVLYCICLIDFFCLICSAAAAAACHSLQLWGSQMQNQIKSHKSLTSNQSAGPCSTSNLTYLVIVQLCVSQNRLKYKNVCRVWGN